ncbi:LysM peptidoglycan-binding domain-containing protein [Aspergillus glaucus CBS 516.65]|uniref:LysM domain-containing protein n=1 Tax=Aspergillus glaucus CBS 516.65 TaxID=1160497 RepID=A0A1L9VPW8_ASPGL|nr:hypothetical protein ASPGLDRAFT_1296037 [Aspergillus glaucus CBS 516.65]OJJ85956.1 hypothetical protein ASPGLDRAFT_1296037 [Aspergillus glaucus CBS 516.65]
MHYLQANQVFCLPSQCAIHEVKANETCTSIVDSLGHTVSTATFRSWNPSINVDCSNVDAFVGDYLCVSHFFYSYPSITTTTATYNATNYQLTQKYTLCEQALAYCSITSADELNEYIERTVWVEKQRLGVHGV